MQGLQGMAESLLGVPGSGLFAVAWVVALAMGAGACAMGYGCCVGDRLAEKLGWCSVPGSGGARGFVSASLCERCGSRLGVSAWPVMGWVVGCRGCGWRGPLAYPLLELAGAAGCGFAALQGVWPFVLAMMLCVLGGMCAGSDVRCRMVPEMVSLPLAVCCLALSPMAAAEGRIWGLVVLGGCAALASVASGRDLLAGAASLVMARGRAEKEAGGAEAEACGGGPAGVEAEKPGNGEAEKPGNGEAEKPGDGEAEKPGDGPEDAGRQAEEMTLPSAESVWAESEVRLGGADVVLLGSLGALGGLVAKRSGALTPWIVAGMMGLFAWWGLDWAGLEAVSGLRRALRQF